MKDLAKDSNKRVFHSFRHTVVHHLQQRNVDEKRIRVMMGHATGDMTYYQHGIGLKKMAEEVVAVIDYGLDFSHLLDKQNNEYLNL